MQPGIANPIVAVLYFLICKTSGFIAERRILEFTEFHPCFRMRVFLIFNVGEMAPSLLPDVAVKLGVPAQF